MINSSPPPVLVLGMHRSGTSFLASRVAAHGVAIGKELVGAQPGNPRGHFEDAEILRFHERLIRARRPDNHRAFDDTMMVGEPLLPRWSEAEQAEAQALLEARAKSAGLWGWKEPRTALFLDEWEQLAPGLRGIIVFRHPLAVHFSALRRRHWDLVLFPDQVLRAYVCYNQALLEAAERAPDRFLVVSAESSFDDLGRLDRRLAEFLGTAAPAADELPAFHREEFENLKLSGEAEAAFTALAPEAMRVYRALEDRTGQASSKSSVNEPSANKPWSRALEIPAFEERYGDARYTALRMELAEEIGKKIRETEAWNQKAQKIFEANAWIEEQRRELGEKFAKQQAFLDKHTKDFTRLWEKHKELGNNWVRSNERVAAQAQRIEELEARLAAFEAPPTENPQG
jgi:hypothetical protein